MAIKPRSTKTDVLLIAGAALLLFLAGQCLEQVNLLLSGKADENLCRWDCGWFRSVVAGYDIEPHGHERGDAANWGFFPLFPLSAKILHLVARVSPDAALVATGKFFFLMAIFSFILFARAWLPECGIWVAGLVVTFSPYSIYGNVGYSESLFLALTCLSLYFLKRNRYLLSAFFSAFLGATRIVGAGIGFSYLAWVVRRWPQLERRVEILLGLCLVPAGLAAYMLYLYHHMGDALAFSHAHVAWNHQLGNPLKHAASVFQGSTMAVTAGISLFIVFLAAVQLARARHYELLLFTLVATALPLCTGLSSMPRYIWWQAPVLFAIAAFMTRKRRALPLYLAISIVFSFMIYRAWFTGANWVI